MVAFAVDTWRKWLNLQSLGLTKVGVFSPKFATNVDLAHDALLGCYVRQLTMELSTIEYHFDLPSR